MARQWPAAWLILASVAGSNILASEPSTGLQPGELAGSFNVYDVTGPAAGKTLCYRCRMGNRPVVAVFVRELTAEVARLIQGLDKAVDDHERARLAAFVVVLADTNHKLDVQKQVREFAREQRLQTPITIYESVAGPKEYRLAANAQVTVLMWQGGEVKSALAFAPGRLNTEGVSQVLAGTAKLLP